MNIYLYLRLAEEGELTRGYIPAAKVTEATLACIRISQAMLDIANGNYEVTALTVAYPNKQAPEDAFRRERAVLAEFTVSRRDHTTDNCNKAFAAEFEIVRDPKQVQPAWQLKPESTAEIYRLEDTAKKSVTTFVVKAEPKHFLQMKTNCLFEV